MAYALLLLAIASEVAATSLLGRTEGFTRPLWTTVCLSAYGVSFYLLAQVVQHLPVGIAYALWSGLGTAAIVLIGATFLGQVPNLPTVGGIVLIAAGVLTVHLAQAH
ncbi:multidrug efflux SMR transporter [Nocardioides sp. SYSU D00065]|uniref:DMT family transporter n=1 Tax=Nocardioides sp. SYSU D00065 TaxID=2817378 RepID=UPI001B33834C|nr:multidrug efflux SMR transporter [Nocardioides sp. SYSU D00065]